MKKLLISCEFTKKVRLRNPAIEAVRDSDGNILKMHKSLSITAFQRLQLKTLVSFKGIFVVLVIDYQDF